MLLDSESFKVELKLFDSTNNAGIINAKNSCAIEIVKCFLESP